MDDIEATAAKHHEDASHQYDMAAKMHHEAAKHSASGNFEKAEHLGILGQVTHGAEPQAQRHVGGGNARAGDRRGLAMAAAALEQPANSIA